MNASNQELSLNKLLILYMLNISTTPLTNSIISEFILNKGYTNYFSLQEYLNQMVETNLLKITTESHRTFYQMTEDGNTTLDFFENRIPESSKKEIQQYLKDNKFEIKSSFEISADYYQQIGETYLVECIARENKTILMELKIMVYSKEDAVKICENWKTNNHIIYKHMLSELIKE